jgi:hypothetical protein
VVSSDGATHQHEAVELAPGSNRPHDTLVVELRRGDTALATGTIQGSELHKASPGWGGRPPAWLQRRPPAERAATARRPPGPTTALPPPTRAQIAGQADLFSAPPESSARALLGSLFPCLRQRGTGMGGATMAWVKLVDDAGRTAGHAVLSARMVTSVGPSGEVRPRRAEQGVLRTAPQGAVLLCPVLPCQPLPARRRLATARRRASWGPPRPRRRRR